VGESAVEEWVDENVDLAESSAASYLATIPDVSDPARLARKYVVATLQTYLELVGVRDRLEDPSDVSDVESAVDASNPVPGLDHVRPVLDDESFHRDLIVALLADSADLSPDVPVSHFSLGI
jgi:phosphoglycerol geranylgeranyltransferase